VVRLQGPPTPSAMCKFYAQRAVCHADRLRHDSSESAILTGKIKMTISTRTTILEKMEPDI
jgi:hypothetical protein